jgi:hypothetical protein
MAKEILVVRNTLSALKAKLLGRSRPTGAPRRTSSFRPNLESLDERLVPSITYNGGPVIKNAWVSAIYLGDAWNTDATLKQERQQLDSFLKDVVNSPYMDALNEYYMNDPYLGQVHVGHGTYAGGKVVSYSFRTSNGIQVVDDNAVQAVIQQQIDGGYVSGGGIGSLVMVFTPSTVRVVSNGGGSNNYLQELGHHSSYVDPWYSTTPYAILANPVGNPNGYWAGTPTNISKLTGVTSHELEEAVVDPIPGTGWYDYSPPTRNGPYGQSPAGITEIGDEDAYWLPNDATYGTGHMYSILNGYVVQTPWSVRAGNTASLPLTPQDLTGDVFLISNNNISSTYYVGAFSISSENPTTGAFTGTYQDFLTGTVLLVSGQISPYGGAFAGWYSSISFHSYAAYGAMHWEYVSFSGSLSGYGVAGGSHANSVWGTMTDNLVFGSFYTDSTD